MKITLSDEAKQLNNIQSPPSNVVIVYDTIIVLIERTFKKNIHYEIEVYYTLWVLDMCDNNKK